MSMNLNNITNFYKTEGWLETDHFGSGYHLVEDHFRPNLWMKVFKYDGAVGEVVGLPNNILAGRSSGFKNGSSSGIPYPPGGGYDKLMNRIPWETAMDSIDPSSGQCSGSGRCYGDFLNNDEIWSASAADVADKNGDSFFLLSERMNGKARTRYRFQIFVEDNSPYWLKDKDGGYDLAKHEDAPEGTQKYYPLQDVVVRIKELSSFDESTIPAIEDSSEDELYVRKSEWRGQPAPDDFKIEDQPAETRLVNGYPVYNFTVFHSFRKAVDYMVEVTAVDIAGNRRILRIPLSMSPVGALSIQDRASQGKRTN